MLKHCNYSYLTQFSKNLELKIKKLVTLAKFRNIHIK